MRQAARSKIYSNLPHQYKQVIVFYGFYLLVSIQYLFKIQPMSVEAILTSLRSGPKTAAELCAQLGLSQPTLSRRLQEAGARVVRVGSARDELISKLQVSREGALPQLHFALHFPKF
ncbi:ArsR family transcriptional regulator [Chromobacterium subtsugae]|uniref:ArsR family transcriptional regulator n=1 Tax=Chromobacterium subtsugae TaxID=251747 RepID=UPI001364C8F8|nr:ArsR family transcriptional regulator [Chromobacterium subtsugae]